MNEAQEILFATIKNICNRAPGIEAAIPKDAVGQAVTMFEPQECANYFKSCGYDPE